MQITQAIKKAVFKVWEKRTYFLPSARIWKEKYGRETVATLAVLTLAALLVLARTVWAADPPTKAPSFAEDFIWPLLAYVAEWIASLFGQLLLWAIDLLIQLSKYNSFLDSNVVSVGWVLVRDVANMFFILIMLVIAFGTMLKIEAYSWKKLLPRLILTALLVNFSKTFIGLLIDFSQVIMLTFVNGYAAAAGGNFMKMFQINKLFSVSAGADFSGKLMTDDNISFSAALGFALGAVMLGIALIVVLIFAALLVFRIITLWILIVLSPLAFLLGTFPKGQEYYGQWWKQLQGQIILGPMVAFFLWLSLAALGGGDINSQIQYNENQTGDLNKINESAKISTQTEIGEWDNIASFAVSIAMLLMSLQMIQQLGVAGAGLASGALSTIKSKATGFAKKLAVPVALGMGVPIAPVLGLGATYGAGAGAWWLGKKAVVGGAKYAAEGVWTRTKTAFYDNKTLSKIPAWFAYGSEHRKKELERAKEYSMASERMRYERNAHGVTPDYLRLAKIKREMEKAKDFGPQFEDPVYASATTGKMWMEKFRRGESFNNEEAGLHRGLSRALFEAAYVDDILDGEGAEFDEIRATLLHDVVAKNEDGTVNEEETKKLRRTKSSENYRKLMIRGLTGDTKDVDDVLWRSDEEWSKLEKTDKKKYDTDQKRKTDWEGKHQSELGLLSDMKDVGKKTGHFENMGLASYDSKNKQYSMSTLDGQARIIATDLAKMSLVEKAKVNPHSLMQMFGYDKKGDGVVNRPDGMTDLGRQIFSSWMQGMDETNLSRNLLGRSANVMLGLGPREPSLKHIAGDKEGGWLRLDEQYVQSKNGADALKLFFSNPLMLRGLFSKVTNVNSSAIGNNMDKFKFVVGNKEVSLKEISENGGDIEGVLKKKKEDNLSKKTIDEDKFARASKAKDDGELDDQTKKLDDTKFKKRYGIERAAANDAIQQGPPQKPPAEEEVISSAMNDLIGEITEKGAAGAVPGAVDVAGIESAVDAIKAAGEDTAKALEGVVKQLAGLKDLGKIGQKLSGIVANKNKDGQPTAQANVAYLLQQLIN